MEHQIELIIDELNKCNIIYDKIDNLNISDYDEIGELYKNIKGLIENIFKKIEINISVNNCIDVLYLNPFIDGSIKSKIVNNTKNHKIIFNTDGGIITLNYITNSNIDNNDLYLIKMILIRTVFIKILSGNKLDNIIYVWKCNINKEFPSNAEILGPKHVNSGSTLMSDFLNGIIYIWRFEELEKVLIHELIHSLNININNECEIKSDKIIDKYFNLKTKCYVNEAYTEFLATILNCLVYAYDNNLDEYRFNNMIELELKFSKYQVSKILLHQKYNNFQELYKNNDKSKVFEENTNIFAYYVIKTLFLENYSKILFELNILDILRTNIYQYKTIALFDKFEYDNMELSINNIISHIKQNIEKNNTNTLRMTCINNNINLKYMH